jgi:hypothetical protein
MLCAVCGGLRGHDFFWGFFITVEEKRTGT